MLEENNTETDKGTLYIRRLPQDLRDDFKAWCAKRGMSMKEKIVELMQLTLKGYTFRRTPKRGVQGNTTGV